MSNEATTRREYEMSVDDREKILDASKPTPVMSIDGKTNMFGTPQENANRAWKVLGQQMGFDYITVTPLPDKGDRFFTAEGERVSDQAITISGFKDTQMAYEKAKLDLMEQCCEHGHSVDKLERALDNTVLPFLPLLDKMGKALEEMPIPPSNLDTFRALGSPIRWMTRYREWHKENRTLLSRYHELRGQG